MVATLRPIEGLHDGRDEQAAQKIEAHLVELGMKFGEIQQEIAWLKGALDEGLPAELLERMESELHDTAGSMSRLMCEARKQVRGE